MSDTNRQYLFHIGNSKYSSSALYELQGAFKATLHPQSKDLN